MRSDRVLCCVTLGTLLPLCACLPPPRPPPQELIRLLPVVLLVGVPILSILVLLREVCLRAQSRERQQAGARADCRE